MNQSEAKKKKKKKSNTKDASDQSHQPHHLINRNHSIRGGLLVRFAPGLVLPLLQQKSVYQNIISI